MGATDWAVADFQAVDIHGLNRSKQISAAGRARRDRDLSDGSNYRKRYENREYGEN